MILRLLGVSTLFLSMTAWAELPSFSGAGLNSSSQPETEVSGLLEGERGAISCRFTRVNVLMGGFAEVSLVVVALKIQPYVELRFNRR